MAARYWNRLRAALREQFLYAREKLRPVGPGPGPDAPLDTQVATFLQGQVAKGTCISDSMTMSIDSGEVNCKAQDVAGTTTLSEQLDSSVRNWRDVLGNPETATEVVTLTFYGIRPEGEDYVHDWVYKKLVCGAGEDPDSLSANHLTDTFSLQSSRYGFFEAELALLEVEQGAVIVASRKAMRAWRESINNCVKLIAALEGIPSAPGRKIPSLQRIEKMKLALERADQATERAREKADQVFKRMRQKVKKQTEKDEQEREKEGERSAKLTAKLEKIAKRDAEIKRKEGKIQKEKKQLLKQASFMKKFVKSAIEDNCPMPANSFTSFKTMSRISGAKKINAVNHQTPIVIFGNDVKTNVSSQEHQPSSVVTCTRSHSSRHWQFLPLCEMQHAEADIPIVTSGEAMCIAQWLTCLIQYYPEDVIDVGIKSQKVDANSLEVISKLLSEARARRKAALRRLPFLLREHRRMRRETRHDLFPRCANLRADIRGRAGRKFNYAPYKLLQFHHEIRPPFVGTMRKRSKFIKPRFPFAKDPKLDYDYDSADEWEDEDEAGESLSDDEKEKELEDAELKSLGLFGCDDESDDDFLDDDEDDIRLNSQSRLCIKSHGIYNEEMDDEPDSDDRDADEAEEDYEIRYDTGHPADLEIMAEDKIVQKSDSINNDVDADLRLPLSSLKRSIEDVNGVELIARKACRITASNVVENSEPSRYRRRKRRSTRGARLPSIKLVGPVFVDLDMHPVLDKFPILRHESEACITMYNPFEEAKSDAATAITSSNATTPRSQGSTSKRRREVLDEDGYEELARSIEGSARGRDALVEKFITVRRNRFLDIPSKAEVYRAIDRIGIRAKGQPWRIRDPSLSKRLAAGCSQAVLSDMPGSNLSAGISCTAGKSEADEDVSFHYVNSKMTGSAQIKPESQLEA